MKHPDFETHLNTSIIGVQWENFYLGTSKYNDFFKGDVKN